MPHYKNVNVEYIPHHHPTAYFMDKNYRLIHEESLNNQSPDQMFALFERYGLEVIPK
eukprot:CAMPEP_0175094362 /NCGR_PEP_ID=MMETSP0086_2-20121207/3546_1 /TAXON_ID=136419 /ORGANISM="Unknown Unknown, Strain D1" /LENGTH=56 /DNA_ID=CAMNT_0016367467 /DNA_START=155 /DNA_END=325 /DNA_ORIENTATION=+